MKTYSVVDKVTKEVINNIVWDGESPIEDGLLDTYDLIAWDENVKGLPASIGFIYNDATNEFTPPQS
jgi:hypothetical protein